MFALQGTHSMCGMMYGYVCCCLETASFHMPLVSKQLSKSWTVVLWDQTGLLLSCHTDEHKVSTSALGDIVVHLHNAELCKHT